LLVCGRFGRAAKNSGPLGRNFHRQVRSWIVRTRQTGIEMDLAEPSRDTLPHQLHGAGHGGGGGRILPGMGTKVIAADYHFFYGKISGGRQGLDEGDVFRGPHAGVTAELVDLVGGGLYQENITVCRRLVDGGFQNGSVRRADGGDTSSPAG
jgi:hypothetical protein